MNIHTTFLLFIVVVQFNTIRAHDDDGEFEEPSAAKVEPNSAGERHFVMEEPKAGSDMQNSSCYCRKEMGWYGSCLCNSNIDPTSFGTSGKYVIAYFSYLPKTEEIRVVMTLAGGYYVSVNRTVPALNPPPICEYPQPGALICIVFLNSSIENEHCKTLPFVFYKEGQEPLRINSIGWLYMPFPRDLQEISTPLVEVKAANFALNEEVDNGGDKPEEPQSFPRCGRWRC